MKRILSVCICIIFVFLCAPFTAFAADVYTHNVNAFNSTREADFLVIYTGGDTTGTNQWGYEVSVDSHGIVTKAGGNNSAIPKGGFVVSAHGEAKTWLTQYGKKGYYCVYNDLINTVSFSSEPIDRSYSKDLSFNGVNIFRQQDAIVIFTEKQGKTTGSNEWGYEVSVDKNGRVISLGGNNSTIPTGGFVLSGHGNSATILKELVLDALISYDPDKLIFTVTIDGRTAIHEANEKIKEAENLYNECLDGYILADYDAADADIKEAKKIYAGTDLSDSKACFASYDSIIELLNEAHKVLAESVPGEYRGVWLRPVETTQTAVAKRVQELYEGGINMIAIETFYGGYMIFPTPAGSPFEQNPDFNKFDVLQAYITECRKRNMEIHLWCPNFYAGSSNTIGLPKKHPEWLLQSNTGSTEVPTSYGTMYFLNPFNSEAMDALRTIYRYIFSTYDIDAFQLDYIRYPDHGSLDWGYNPEIVAAFKKKYGVEPQYNTKASYWKNWCAFRAESVTDFVRSMREIINKEFPDIMLTADVFTDIDSSGVQLYQDYKTWMQEGLVDMVHPMLYGETDYFVKYAKKIIAASNGVPVVPGTGIFDSYLDANDMLDQVTAARDLGCAGVVHFQAIQYVSKMCPTVLTASAYAGDSFTPHRQSEQAVLAGLEVIEKRVQDVLLPAKAITSAEADGILKAVKAMRESIPVWLAPSESVKSSIGKVSSAKAKAVLLSDINRVSVLCSFLEEAAPEYVTYAQGSAVSAFSLAYGNASVFTDDKKQASEKSAVASGMYLYDSKLKKIAVVRGDLNGDGLISSKDYVLAKRHVLGTYTLRGAFFQAACLTKQNTVSSADYIKIKRHVLHTYTIS